jgi:hypothetical protein
MVRAQGEYVFKKCNMSFYSESWILDAKGDQSGDVRLWSAHCIESFIQLYRSHVLSLSGG